VTRGDTALYQCVITFAGDVDTSGFAHLGVHDEIVFDTLYRYNDLGCPGICKGQLKTLVSGGLPPYSYKWGTKFQDTLGLGLCPGKGILTIIDMRGCEEDTIYFVDALKLPKVGFDVLPNDTVYLTNPTLTMQFSDTAKPYMVNWEWSIEKAPDTTVIFSIANINPATYVFDSTGTFQVYLNFTDQNGCDSTVIRDVVVRTAELKIPYVITPNGDEKNDLFEIRVVGEAEDFDYRIVYLSTELLIWDRWGKKVYSQKDYESGAWDGGNLPDGVYFFLLTCKGQWEDEFFRGTVTILGRSN
jgi:gliding motility-associated-like protein